MANVTAITARPTTTTSTKPRAGVKVIAENTVAPSSTANSTTNNSTQNPLPVSPTYVARLPSYSEVVQLVKTSLPFFTFSDPQQQPQPPDSIHLPNKPWASLSLLTRVKFELLLAYTLVQVHRREMAEQQPSLVGLDPPDFAFAQAVSDGPFAALFSLLEEEMKTNKQSCSRTCLVLSLFPPPDDDDFTWKTKRVVRHGVLSGESRMSSRVGR